MKQDKNDMGNNETKNTFDVKVDTGIYLIDEVEQDFICDDCSEK